MTITPRWAYRRGPDAVTGEDTCEVYRMDGVLETIFRADPVHIDEVMALLHTHDLASKARALDIAVGAHVELARARIAAVKAALLGTTIPLAGATLASIALGAIARDIDITERARQELRDVLDRLEATCSDS